MMSNGRRTAIEESSFPSRRKRWIIASILIVIGLLYLFTGTDSATRLFGFAALCFGSAIVWWILTLRSRDRDRVEQLQRTRILDAQDLGRILVQSGAEFEASVLNVLNAHGYSLEGVGRAGDRGVDLQGYDLAGSPVIVQCKRYGPDNKVSSPAVQSFIGAIVNHGATSGIFVATSSFTRDARLLAQQSRVPVQLIDGATFTAMARDASQRL